MDNWPYRPPARRVRAIVIGCVIPGELRLLLEPGSGQLDGSAPRDAPIAAIPRRLRMPNTTLWVELDHAGRIVAASERATDE